MIPQTLSQRLSEGRIPVAEALRYAMILADSLRKIHDDGRAHGAVSPETVYLTGTGLELLPAPTLDSATAYMAPEVLAGRSADSRSDIFSFGTVVYEMLSSKPAFEGSDRSAMASSGSPALDRLVGGCVAKEPSARIQRIQKVMLELKLLAVSASRAAAQAIPRRDPAAEAQLRAEIQHVEERIASRLQESEKALSEAHRLTREDMLQLEMRVAGSVQANGMTLSEGLRTELQQMAERVGSRLEALENHLAAQDPSARLLQLESQLAAALHRIESLEQKEPVDLKPLETSVEVLRTQLSELHDLVAEDFLSFEKSLQAQAAAIDSARTAMAQTDDLVERVVEALESLQSTVLENSEERALAIG